MPAPTIRRGSNSKWFAIAFVVMLLVIFIMINTSYKSLFSKMPPTSNKQPAQGNKLGELASLVKAQKNAKNHAGGILHAINAQRSGNVDQQLLEDVKRLQRAIKLMDDQIESLSDRIEVEDPPAPVSHAPRPTYPLNHKGVEDNTIFVSVASFRDEECGPMMVDLYKKAKTPSKVYAGVVEQHAESDPPCLGDHWAHCQLHEFCPNDNVRVRRIRPTDAKGPTFGRYLAMLMYRGQQYFLMIDSHNRFIPEWDRVMIELIKRAPSDKAVISHYPEAWNKGDENIQYERKTTSRLCKARYLDFGIPRLDATIGSATEDYYPQPWAAAGFLFANAKILHEVPFDPHLDFVFDGEEILYSVRMWTHGWDIFSPGRNTLFHYYYRAKSKKVWSEVSDWHPRQQRALQRVKYLLESTKFDTDEMLVPHDTAPEHVTTELDIYGLGHERTLEQYYAYAGIDKKKRKFNKNWCQEHPVKARPLE